MSSFLHHPDGWITIKNTDVPRVYRATLEQFLTHEPLYSLPNGTIGRIFIANLKHSLLLPDGNETEAPLDWSDGLDYINNVENYLGPIPPDPRKVEREAQLLAARMAYDALPAPFQHTRIDADIWFATTFTEGTEEEQAARKVVLLINMTDAILSIRDTIWDRLP